MISLRSSVPIELNEPPVYIKGKPKYVTVYKSAPPVVKPTTVYHMPVYSPTYEYMFSPSDSYYGSLYSPMMHLSPGSAYGPHYDLSGSSIKSTSSLVGDSLHANPLPDTINFTDYDDEFGNYYLGAKAAASNNIRSINSVSGKRKLVNYSNELRRADSTKPKDSSSSSLTDDSSDQDVHISQVLAVEDREAFDNDDKPNQRVKRQAYESSYENERPCYGFPLEINIKSRIKMDQIFPIHGNSQIKKCIKLSRPRLLPPVDDGPHYPPPPPY